MHHDDDGIGLSRKPTPGTQTHDRRPVAAAVPVTGRPPPAAEPSTLQGEPMIHSKSVALAAARHAVACV